MGRREGNDAKEATAPRECGQWRGISEFRVRVRGVPAALAAYLNQKLSLTLRQEARERRIVTVQSTRGTSFAHDKLGN